MNKPIVGILGDGQLAKYLVNTASEMGYKALALGLNSGECIADAMHVSGNIYDRDDVIKFSQSVDILTLENEFIPLEILKQVKHKLAPSYESFEKINTKIKEKAIAKKCSIPLVHFDVIDLELSHYPGVGMYKLSSGGYDGKGNFLIKSESDYLKMSVDLNKRKITTLIKEDILNFDKEVSITIVRNELGTIEYYPIVDTIQTNQVCTSVSAPALLNQDLKHRIRHYSKQLVDTLDYCGVMSIEFFIKDEQIYYNECSPRPHNSAHYTMDACYTSQFENHLRAILGLPLGLADLRVPCALMVNVLGREERKSIHENDIVKFSEDSFYYRYGKREERIGRKMGHLSLIGENKSELSRNASLFLSQLFSS